jgi:hypothetical protein
VPRGLLNDLTSGSHLNSDVKTEHVVENDMDLVMARISGLEKKDVPWHLRWFYGEMRKMFGKDFTPAKIQMRLPGLVWGGIAMEAGLGRKRLISLRYIQLGKTRAAARIGCPF